MLAKQDLFSEGDTIPQIKEYRRIIGSLQYLTLTRLDIQSAMNKLSQYLSNPKQVHWVAMKRVLRYLSGTHKWGIKLKKVNDYFLQVFVMLIGVET